MYYHCRDLKHVIYGKVYPYRHEDDDEFFSRAYDWLGHHCGYSPQVWLSRSLSCITGFRRNAKNNILFGFENIKGFPLRYSPWEFIMMAACKFKEFEKQNKEICRYNDDIIRDLMEYKEELDDDLKAWMKCERNLDRYLKEHVFVLEDQVVVPSLNLKSAKKIICRNEKQKKALRKMGFIEDRIKIKNVKKWTY